MQKPRPDAGGRRALLVGINRYPLFPPQNQLRGCLNDVAAMRELLVEGWSFPPGNIRELLDERATAAAIRGELQKLAADSVAGGLVVVYFSGHGSRRPDARSPASLGESAGDEPDGWDETLVPYDSGRHPHPSRDLADDEIHRHLAAILERGARVLFIVDACRSGTVFRDQMENGLRLRQAPADRAAPAASARAMPAGPIMAGAADLFASGRLTTLCACADHQGAFEMDLSGQVQGAFTHHLVRAIDRLSPGATFADLRERILLRLQSGFSNQWPRFAGALGAPLPECRASYRCPAAPAHYPRLGCLIDLPPETARSLRQRIALSPWVEEMAAGRPAWAVLEQTAGDRPALAFPADGRPLFLLARKGGDPILAAANLDAEAFVVELETRARQAYLLGLENGDAQSRLSEKLELELWRRQTDGSWLPAEAEDGLAAYGDGERLGLTLANRSATAVHVGILLFGADGSVTLLHPTRAGVARLDPGSVLEIGMGFRIRIVLRAYRPDWRAAPPYGDVEQVKVFASTSPWGWASWLVDWREGPAPAPTAGRWTTLSRSYRLT